MNIITLENNKKACLKYDLTNCKYLVFDKEHRPLLIIDDIFIAVELFRILLNKNI